MSTPNLTDPAERARLRTRICGGCLPRARNTMDDPEKQEAALDLIDELQVQITAWKATGVAQARMIGELLAENGRLRNALKKFYHHLDTFGFVDGPRHVIESQNDCFIAYHVAMDGSTEAAARAAMEGKS